MRKLMEIEARKPKKIQKDVQKEVSQMMTMKEKSNGFQAQERNLTINRENQILLNKLVEISHGKQVSVGTVKQVK